MKAGAALVAWLLCFGLVTQPVAGASRARFKPAEDGTIGVPEPLQLVRRDPTTNNLTLNTDVVEQLKEWPECVILGVSGSIRTGKSFFANQVRGEQKGFHVGHTELSETEGLWIWGQPLVIEDVPVMLIDMEGFGGLGTDDTYETLLFTLLSSVSHSMVYHASDVDRLHISNLERFSRRAASFSLHALSTDPSLASWLESAPGDGMPRLTWVVSRFTRELTKAPTDWLLDTIHAEAAAHRVELDHVFPDVSCFTLPPPTADANAIRLDEVAADELTMDFVRSMDIVAFHLRLTLKKDRPVDVATAARVMRVLIQSANSGELVPAPDEWARFERTQTELAKTAALEYFNGLVTNILKRVGQESVPTPNPVLSHRLERAASRAVLHLNHTLFNTATPAAQSSLATLRDMCWLEIEKQLLANSNKTIAHLAAAVAATTASITSGASRLRSIVPTAHARLLGQAGALVDNATSTLLATFQRYNESAFGESRLKQLRKEYEDVMLEVTNANRMRITSMFDDAISAAVDNFTAAIKAYQLPVLPETLQTFKDEAYMDARAVFDSRAELLIGSNDDRDIIETGLRKFDASVDEVFAQVNLLNLRNLDAACDAMLGQLTFTRDKMLEKVRTQLLRHDVRVEMANELRQQLHQVLQDSLIANARHYTESTCAVAFENAEEMRRSLRESFLEAHEECMQEHLYRPLEVIVDRFSSPSTSPFMYPFRFLFLKTTIREAAMEELQDVIEDEAFRSELVWDWLYQESNPLSPLLTRSFRDLLWTLAAIASLGFLSVARRCASGLSL